MQPDAATAPAIICPLLQVSAMVARRQGASSYKAKAASAKAAAVSAEQEQEAKGAVDMQVEPISSAEEEDYSEEEGSYTEDEEDYSSEELVELEDLPEELWDKLPPEALAALKSAQQTSDAPRAASPPAPAPSEPEAPLASQPVPAAPKKKGKRRWDQVSAADGKPPGSTTETTATTGGRRAYRSWRHHKNAILACLMESGGNVAFSRRYLLFHHGVLLPKNVIRYYNSYCR